MGQLEEIEEVGWLVGYPPGTDAHFASLVSTWDLGTAIGIVFQAFNATSTFGTLGPSHAAKLI